MVFDDAQHDRESQPGPLSHGFGREEGLPDIIEFGFRYSRPGITHLDDNAISLVSDSDGKRSSAVADGMVRVGEQIDEDLLHLLGIPHDPGQIRV